MHRGLRGGLMLTIWALRQNSSSSSISGASAGVALVKPFCPHLLDSVERGLPDSIFCPALYLSGRDQMADVTTPYIGEERIASGHLTERLASTDSVADPRTRLATPVLPAT